MIGLGAYRREQAWEGLASIHSAALAVAGAERDAARAERDEAQRSRADLTGRLAESKRSRAGNVSINVALESCRLPIHVLVAADQSLAIQIC